ncbi:hypothetical protein JCM10296v2_003895 [Rhodotorula toruloides]
MSAVPASFDGASALRHKLDAARKEREEQLAFLRWLEDLVRQYVRFWHVRICKKPAQDLANYSPVLTPRPVQPGATPSFYVAPFVTAIYLTRNRGSGNHLISASGFLWMDKASALVPH